jgi:hypothetical protein
MAEPEDYGVRDRPHISISAFREAAQYSFPTRAQQRKPLREDYAAHAAGLLNQLDRALGDLPAPNADARLSIDGLKPGTVVEVSTLPPSEGSRAKAVKIPANLEFPAQDIVVLRTERRGDRTESALLFVPDEARGFLRGRITAYGGYPGNARRPDVERFEVVETIAAAQIRSLFVGEVDFAAPDIAWWELWVQGRVARAERVAMLARAANLDVHADRLVFPDTTVVFVHAAASALVAFAGRVAGAVGEIRRATGTIEPFLDRGAGGVGQRDWVAELAGRVEPPSDAAPTVCILDTGVAAAHPLVAPGLKGAWAYDAAWGTHDHEPDGGHGTGVAGLVLWRPRAAHEWSPNHHTFAWRRIYEASAAGRLPANQATELRSGDARGRGPGRGPAAEFAAQLLSRDIRIGFSAEPSIKLERRAGPGRSRLNAR